MRFANLNREDFPLTIIVESDDTHEPIWGVTLVRAPAHGAPIPLYIPSLREYGPVSVLTITGQGVLARTGPYTERSKKARKP